MIMIINLEHNSNDSSLLIIYPQQIVKAVALTLNQLKGYLQDGYKVHKVDIFTTGYLEGGAYSIWFSECFDPGRLS